MPHILNVTEAFITYRIVTKYAWIMTADRVVTLSFQKLADRLVKKIILKRPEHELWGPEVGHLTE